MIVHDAEDCECCEKAHEMVADLDESNIVIERGAVELRKAQRRIEELEHQIGNLRSQWPQILKDGQRYINEANVEFAKRKTAESRIAELEAQVARHPEQLRRVAEATTIDDARRLESLFSVPLASVGFLEGVRRCVAMLRHGRTTTALDAIIAEALK